jgi:AbrB family looped-hinge helix DNA binding protein
MPEVVKIDKLGRIVIPKKIRELLGIEENTRIVLERRDKTIILTPTHKKQKNISQQISKMNLPVDEWEKMEEEISKGAKG